jgi:hypothetical protein
MNQSRNRTQYDENYATCYAVTGIASDLWNGGVNNTETGYQSTEDETCDTLNPVFSNCRNFEHSIGTAFSQSITATDANGIDNYWLNDTSKMNVSNTGLIMNTTSLNSMEILSLMLFVNDTRSKEANCSFYIDIKTITPSTTIAQIICAYDIFGYYNHKLPSIKQTGCIGRKW